MATLTGFGGTGYYPCVGDFDGDGKADPAIYNTASGDWQVAMSSIGYTIQSAPSFGGAGYAAVQENYDSDHRFDAAIYLPAEAALQALQAGNETNGNWTILLSASSYITATLDSGWTP